MGETITVKLPAELAEKVRELAHRSGRDLDCEVAALLRWFVTEHEEAERRGWEAFDRIAAGMFDGPGDLADRHDEYLYGAKRPATQ